MITSYGWLQNFHHTILYNNVRTELSLFVYILDYKNTILGLIIIVYRICLNHV
jgi:hypothetical protein